MVTAYRSVEYVFFLPLLAPLPKSVNRGKNLKEDKVCAHCIHLVVNLCIPLNFDSSHYSDDSVIHYDYLVLATGGKPREMESVPGNALKNIYQLRTPEDANAILAAAQDKHVVVVGSSYIGLV